MRCEQSFDRCTLEQKRVIARFPEFMALEACQHGPAAGVTWQDTQVPDLAERAGQSYWFKIALPAAK